MPLPDFLSDLVLAAALYHRDVSALKHEPTCSPSCSVFAVGWEQVSFGKAGGGMVPGFYFHTPLQSLKLPLCRAQLLPCKHRNSISSLLYSMVSPDFLLHLGTSLIPGPLNPKEGLERNWALANLLFSIYITGVHDTFPKISCSTQQLLHCHGGLNRK